MKSDYSSLLARFESNKIDPKEFGHRQHIQVAYEMLDKHGFLSTCLRYSAGINKITVNAGALEKFNMTITLAYLSLIAERAVKDNVPDFENFLANNEDLLDKKILDDWYTPERLHSELARRLFILP